jgi:hypothetical protein
MFNSTLVLILKTEEENYVAPLISFYPTMAEELLHSSQLLVLVVVFTPPFCPILKYSAAKDRSRSLVQQRFDADLSLRDRHLANRLFVLAIDGQVSSWT